MGPPVQLDLDSPADTLHVVPRAHLLRDTGPRRGANTTGASFYYSYVLVTLESNSTSYSLSTPRGSHSVNHPCYRTAVAFRRRQEEKRTNVLAVRLTDEEMALVDWAAEQLAAREKGKFSGADVAREGLALLVDGLQREAPAAAARKKRR